MTKTDNIINLKGIGPKSVELFSKLKVHTIEDLVRLYPRTYLSYDNPVSISQAEVGQRVAIKASIQSYVEVKRVRKLMIVSCMAKDTTGTMKLVWYNAPYLKQVFHIGQTYVFVGTMLHKNGQYVIEHPEYYTMEQFAKLNATLRPVYPLTEGLSNKTVTKTMELALPYAKELVDLIPEEIRSQYGYVSLEDAIRGMHFPKDMEQLSRCRQRLVFDEFFTFMVRMRQLKEHNVKSINQHVMKDYSAINHFVEALPFALTKGQLAAIDEIKQDMQGETVMNRLIQGDVGSGKTVVAEVAILAVVKNGYQAAMMAPTEVLATQHYEGISRDLEPYGIKVALLVGSTKPSEKRKLYQELEQGEIDVIIGTHALIQDKVIYKNLALVVTDEQHRFGVKQRTALWEKGYEPHVLVMSATPIPRTLAIIMYGDLDISIMKDLPASRLPIKNCVVGDVYRPTAYKFMNDQISGGHQIYIICAMVEASDNVEAENVIDYTESIKQFFPSTVNIEYLHGKMNANEKNEIMNRFAKGEIHILVSTTVIEVGINNPNATVMMIENAERFGLAQLHQLRGRVGRGSAQSYCIFVCGSDSEQAKSRLDILNHSNDGFYIANEDLKLRGPGEFFGVRQSGDILFSLADIYGDADVLKQANDAMNLLEKNNFNFDQYLQNDIDTMVQL